MYGKMQDSGLPEIIPLISTLSVWGQHPLFSSQVPAGYTGYTFGGGCRGRGLGGAIRLFPPWVPFRVHCGVEDRAALIVWWLQILCLLIRQVTCFIHNSQDILHIKGMISMSPCVFIFLYIERASLMAQTIKSSPAMQERPRLDPWVRKSPWRREWKRTPVCWPGGFHGQRSLVGSSPWGSWSVRHDWVANTILYRKALKPLTWDLWVFVISCNLLMFDYKFFFFQQSSYKPWPLCYLLGAILQSYLRGCLPRLQSSVRLPNKR